MFTDLNLHPWATSQSQLDSINAAIREDAVDFMNAALGWYANRIETSRGLSQIQRRRYDNATKRFTDFILKAEKYLREDNFWDDDGILTFDAKSPSYE